MRLTLVVRGPRQTCIWTSQKRHIPHIRTTTPNSHHTTDRTGAWQTLHVHYQGGNIISLRRTLPSMLCTCLTSMLSYAFFLNIFKPIKIIPTLRASEASLNKKLTQPNLTKPINDFPVLFDGQKQK